MKIWGVSHYIINCFDWSTFKCLISLIVMSSRFYIQLLFSWHNILCWIWSCSHSYAQAERSYFLLTIREWNRALNIDIIFIWWIFHHSTCSFGRNLARIQSRSGRISFGKAFGKIWVNRILIFYSWTITSHCFDFASCRSREWTAWATLLLFAFNRPSWSSSLFSWHC
jgi:hypothetical protein